MSNDTIQVTIERPDGVRLIVSGNDAIEVTQTVIVLESRVRAEPEPREPQPPSDSQVDEIAAHVLESITTVLGDEAARRSISA